MEPSTNIEKIDHHINKIINLIYKNLKFILIITLFGAFIGLLYSFKIKREFIAQISFILEEERVGASGGASAIANQFGFDLGNNSASNLFGGANFFELLRSRQLIEKTLTEDVLIDGKVISLFMYYKKRNQDDSITIEKLFLLISENLSVGYKDKRGGSTLIQLEFKNIDEKFTYYFLNNLLKNSSILYINNKTSKAQKNLNILQSQSDSLRKILKINLNENINSAQIDDSKFNIQIASNLLIQVSSNLQIAKLNLLKETPLFQILDNSKLPLKQSKILWKYYTLLFASFTFLIIILIIIKKHKNEF